MKYQVPQFLDLEDKIVGTLTVKQFFYLVSVPLILYGLSFVVELPFLILIGVIFVPFSFLLAFKKVNGKPFINVIGSFLGFSLKPQLYIWRRLADRPILTAGFKHVGRRKKSPPASVRPRLTPLKIRLLAMRLDRGELDGNSVRGEVKSVKKEPEKSSQQKTAAAQKPEPVVRKDYN